MSPMSKRRREARIDAAALRARQREARARAMAAAEALRLAGDPRELSSDQPIVDVAEDPYAQGGVVIDTRTAVLLSGINVAAVELTREGKPAGQGYAMSLRGKVNQSPDEVAHLYLTDLDGLADVVAELFALASRAGLAAPFTAAVEHRLSALPV